jgi:ankyrin repeat protein
MAAHRQGADIDAKDNYGRTALIMACGMVTEIAMALIEKGQILIKQ